jgi:hypothetical protein
MTPTVPRLSPPPPTFLPTFLQLISEVANMGALEGEILQKAKKK